MSKFNVHHTFQDETLPGLVIMWKVNSNELSLCRIGGPAGNYVLDSKKHHSYKTAEGAEAGAKRWFTILASVFNVTQPENAEATTKQKVVVQQG